MTFADTPIRHFQDDTLGRGGFAKQIGKIIYNLDDVPNGFVIAINGEWGSGKTSVMNMAVQTLKHLQMEKDSERCLSHGETIITLSADELDDLAMQYARIEDQFDFENYDYSYLSHDQFNKRVAHTLEPADKLYRYFQLERYRQNNPENLVVNFSPWLIPHGAGLAAAFITDLTRSITPILGEDVKNAFKLYAARIAELEPIVTSVVKTANPLAGSLVSALSFLFKTTAAKDKSLDTLKADLEKQLGSLKRQKIIIVIDDLDRLTPTECAEMIGLVKGLGNLPNVVYLLGLDKQEVTKNLNTAHERGDDFGTNYLEKIIQYERDLPPVSKDSFANILTTYIKEPLDNGDDDLQRRFRDGWNMYIKHKINTQRDVKKVGEHFKVSYGVLKEFTDPSDLLLLETTKIKSAKIYRWICINIAILNGTDQPPYSEGDYGKNLKKWINDQAFSAIEIALLSLLFPNIAKALNEFASGEAPSKASVSKRLSNSNFSGRYFEISPPIGSWSKNELKNLISSSDPKSALAEMLKRAETATLHQSNLRIELLDEIEARWDDIKDNLQSWFNAIIHHSRELTRHKDDRPGFVGQVNNFRRMEYMILPWVKEITPERRVEILSNSISTATDISLLCNVVRRAIKDLNGKAPHGDGTSLDGKEDEIRNALLGKISELVRDGQFWQQADPIHIIYFWNGSTTGTEVHEFLNKEVANDTAFEPLCDFLINTTYSTDGDFDYIPDYARKLMNVDKMKTKAEGVLKTGDDPRKTIAERLLKAYNNPKT